MMNMRGTYAIAWVMGSFLTVPALQAQRVYWTNNGRIQRAYTDGTDIETILSNRLNRPLYVALDEAARMIYWTDGQVFGTAPVIRRCRFDGTQLENIVTQGLSGPSGIALDTQAGKLYWADTGLGVIKRANLDGAGVEIVISGLVLPHGLAIDPMERRLYWSGKAEDFFTTSARGLTVAKSRRCSSTHSEVRPSTASPSMRQTAGSTGAIPSCGDVGLTARSRKCCRSPWPTPRVLSLSIPSRG
jgi:hypothetical protein